MSIPFGARAHSSLLVGLAVAALATASTLAGCAAGRDDATNVATEALAEGCTSSVRTLLEDGSVAAEGNVTCPGGTYGYRLFVQLQRLDTGSGFWRPVHHKYGSENVALEGLDMTALTPSAICAEGETFRAQTTVYRPAAFVDPQLWENMTTYSDAFTCGEAPEEPEPSEPAQGAEEDT